MRQRLLGAVLFAAVVLAPAGAWAQAPALVEVLLRDRTLVVGVIVADEPARLLIRTAGGAEVSVPRDRIQSITPAAGQIVGDEFWLDDALASKLFLGATGRALKRGEGYLAIDALILPVVQVGVTDRFSLGFGAPFYGLARSAWITPKLQVYRGAETSVSTGVLHLFVPDFGLGGYAYVAATRGTPNGAVTVGGGWLYGREEDEDSEGLPMFSLGGERRLGRRTKFVTENYLFREGVIATAGARLIGRRFSGEIGAIVVFSNSGSAPPGIFFNLIWHSRAAAGAGRAPQRLPVRR